MPKSRLSSKYQVTPPEEGRAVRDKDKKVMIRKASSLDRAYLKSIDSMLQEWSSAYDNEDYRDL